MNCDRCTAYTGFPWRNQDTREWLCNQCADGWCFEPCAACRQPVRVRDADWCGSHLRPRVRHAWTCPRPIHRALEPAA